MFQHTLFAKKTRYSNTAFFVDFDGTIFTPDKKIISAPWYNMQTTRILKKYAIPLVIVTGRSTWTTKSEIETVLLGLPKPDVVIAGAGSRIFYRLTNGQLALDTSWDRYMSYTSVKRPHVEKTSWDRETILQIIHSLLPAEVKILPHSADTYLIRLYVKSMPIKKLLEIKQSIEKYFTSGIQIIFTEKLLQPNTTEIFSGNILIVPVTAGKENAIKYILKAAPIKHAYCFGDATIDVPMLTIPSQKNGYTMHTYGVNLTPLAKKTLQQLAKSNPQLHIIDSPHSPQAILEIAKSIALPLKNSLPKKFYSAGTHFSPAQNTPARRILQPFESFLDSFFDKTLTADQISFKGLELIKKSIDRLYAEEKKSVFTKIIIWKDYAIGNSTDIFDGIRARQMNTVSNKGQLTDVFSDRAKEFYQLYKRGEKRLQSNPQQGYYTFLAAISCILPSIARAQAEMSGIIVKEQDAKGGSMLARTRKLFSSFFFETIGLDQESFRIDQELYHKNIATYQNRISAGNTSIYANNKEQTNFQKKAHERFLLLIQLLQEENEIIQNTLKKNPSLSKSYTRDFSAKISKYLKLDVTAERKKQQFTTYPDLALFAKA